MTVSRALIKRRFTSPFTLAFVHKYLPYINILIPVSYGEKTIFYIFYHFVVFIGKE